FRQEAYRTAADRMGRTEQGVLTEAAALSLQRNLRILGVFARLCLQSGRTAYLAHLPRVWRHIEAALATLNEPSLENMLRSALPAPDLDHIQNLKARCGTIPTLS
ncbi:MAG: aminoglycoside phosphotransferase, partial [Pseudomonadota bacterium]